MPPRLGAARVGVRASWWMGALMGLPAFAIGILIVPRAHSYLAAGIGAVVLAFTITIVAAALGLIGGVLAAQTGVFDLSLHLPAGMTQDDLLRAGFMHNASYLGGALGALVAVWPMWRARQIDRQHTLALRP